jgi:hypothetical protein
MSVIQDDHFCLSRVSSVERTFWSRGCERGRRPAWHTILYQQTLAAGYCAAPTVSAIVAPRAPSGFSAPTVVSRAV